MIAGLPLHDTLEPLAGLLGTWQGRGAGDYPTISPFAYEEEVVVDHVGKPFLTYRQRTWDPDTGAPMHSETGYLRIPAPGRVEFLVSHPTGIVEVEEGELDGTILRLATTTLGTASTAKDVRSVRREFRLGDDVLDYDLWMAHAATPETHHLRARLTRVS